MSYPGSNMAKQHLHLSGRVALLLICIFLLLALIVQLAGFSLTAYVTGGATSSPAVLLTHFSFDTPLLTDASGHTRQEGAVVTASLASDQGLDGSGAMQFVANSKQFVALPNKDGFFDRASFSSFVWIRTLDVANANRVPFASKHYYWDTSGWRYSLWDQGAFAGHVQGFGISNADAKGGGLDDMKWHHVGMSYDATSRLVTLYVDGIQVSQFATLIYEDAFLAPLEIGTARQWSQFFFNGYMDEFTFFDRALTADEVGLVYNRNYDLFSSDLTTAQPIITHTAPTDLLVSQSFTTQTSGSLYLDETNYHHDVQQEDALFVPTGGVRDGGFIHFKDDADASQDDLKDNGAYISNTRALSSASITYSWWMRFSAQESPQTMSLPHIFDKQYARPGGTRILLWEDHLQFATSNDNIIFVANGPGMLRDSQWHHYALAFDSLSCEARFFVDGVLYQQPFKVNSVQDFTTIIPGGIDGPSDCRMTPNFYRLRIGNRLGSLYRPLRGDMDEVKIWGRALSDGEVADVYSLDLNGVTSSPSDTIGNGGGTTVSASPFVIPASAPDIPIISAPPGATLADLEAAKAELLRLQEEINGAQLESSYSQEQLQELQTQQQQVQDMLSQLNAGDGSSGASPSDEGIVYQEEQEFINVAPLSEAPALATERESEFVPTTSPPEEGESAFSLPVVLGLILGVLVIIGGTLFILRNYHKRRIAAVIKPEKTNGTSLKNGRH